MDLFSFLFCGCGAAFCELEQYHCSKVEKIGEIRCWVIPFIWL